MAIVILSVAMILFATMTGLPNPAYYSLMPMLVLASAAASSRMARVRIIRALLWPNVGGSETDNDRWTS